MHPHGPKRPTLVGRMVGAVGMRVGAVLGLTVGAVVGRTVGARVGTCIMMQTDRQARRTQTTAIMRGTSHHLSPPPVLC